MTIQLAAPAQHSAFLPQCAPHGTLHCSWARANRNLTDVLVKCSGTSAKADHPGVLWKCGFYMDHDSPAIAASGGCHGQDDEYVVLWRRLIRHDGGVDDRITSATELGPGLVILMDCDVDDPIDECVTFPDSPSEARMLVQAEIRDWVDLLEAAGPVSRWARTKSWASGQRTARWWPRLIGTKGRRVRV